MRGPDNVQWTEEMMVMFETLVADKNSSYADIAAALSSQFNVKLTKNACVGKGRRLGFPPRAGGIRKSEQRKVKIDAPIAAQIPVRIKDQSVSIYQLRYGDCRWPLAEVEDHPPYQFCGRKVVEGKPWCEKHRKRAYSVPRR